MFRAHHFQLLTSEEDRHSFDAMAFDYGWYLSQRTPADECPAPNDAVTIDRLGELFWRALPAATAEIAVPFLDDPAHGRRRFFDCFRAGYQEGLGTAGCLWCLGAVPPIVPRSFCSLACWQAYEEAYPERVDREPGCRFCGAEPANAGAWFCSHDCESDWLVDAYTEWGLDV